MRIPEEIVAFRTPFFRCVVSPAESAERLPRFRAAVSDLPVGFFFTTFFAGFAAVDFRAAAPFFFAAGFRAAAFFTTAFFAVVFFPVLPADLRVVLEAAFFFAMG